MSTVEEIIFLGTGTSSCVPTVPCLTAPEPSCKACLSTLTPKGTKNIRKNTSLLVRVRSGNDPEGRLRNILIDSGKTFYESALRLFPRYHIREIDALIITHGHADAINGMDDLRAWTQKDSIQQYVPIYLDQVTMETVKTSFPYLVDKSKATGGGDVATFQYNIIDSSKPFTIEGLEITPLPVHHGIYHENDDPYWSLGFRFGPVSYVSDTNFIPEATEELIRGSEVFVLDTLREDPHSSHFGISQAVDEVRRLRPQRTYLVGWSHNNDHFELEDRFRALEQEEDKLWVRPAFDGLRLRIVKDEEYLKESSFLDSEDEGGYGNIVGRTSS